MRVRWINREGLRAHSVGFKFVDISGRVANIIESVGHCGFVCDWAATNASEQPQPQKPKQPVTATIDLPDYYRILEIPRNANDKDIRAAYLRLAQAFHPDLNKSPDAQSKFIEIKLAYEVLSDEEQRESYNQQVTAA